MARYLLDTGIIIRHLRGQKRIVKLVRSLSRSDRLAIATVTRLEIYAGMREEEAYITQKLLSRFVNFSLEPAIADRAGKLIAQQSASNNSLTIPDAIIAATAVRHQQTLVTLNTRDFENLPSIRLYPIDS